LDITNYLISIELSSVPSLLG